MFDVLITDVSGYMIILADALTISSFYLRLTYSWLDIFYQITDLFETSRAYDIFSQFLIRGWRKSIISNLTETSSNKTLLHLIDIY